MEYEVCQRHEYLRYGPLCGRSTITDTSAWLVFISAHDYFASVYERGTQFHTVSKYGLN